MVSQLWLFEQQPHYHWRPRNVNDEAPFQTHGIRSQVLAIIWALADPLDLSEAHKCLGTSAITWGRLAGI